MSAPIYATAADLDSGGWLTVSQPANVDALLRSASRMVARSTRAAVYDVDVDGYPTDTGRRDALRDATCAQVAAMATLGIDPAAGGVRTASRIATSKSIDGASIAYAGAAAAADERASAAVTLVPDAYEILIDAGLTNGRVWMIG